MMNNCPNCGRALPAPTVKFCPHCGAACQSAVPEPTYASLRKPPAVYPAAQPAAKPKFSGKMQVIAAACVGLLIVGTCCGIGILHTMHKSESSAESSLTASVATAFYSFLDDEVIPEYGILQTDTALNIGDCSGVLSSYITQDGREMVLVRVGGETLYLDRYRQSEQPEPDDSVTYPDFFSDVYDVSPAPFVIEVRDGVVYVNGKAVLTLDNENENGKVAEVTVGDNNDDYRRSKYIFHDRTPMRDRIKPVPQPVISGTTPKTEPPRTETATRTATSSEKETTTTETTTTVTTTAAPQPVSYLVQYQPVLEQALAAYGYPTADQTDDINDVMGQKNGANGLFVRLIDFDNDGTEELYLAHQNYGANSDQFNKIYTVSGNQAVTIMDDAFTLLPASGIGNYIYRNSQANEYYIVSRVTLSDTNPSGTFCRGERYTFFKKSGNQFAEFSSYLMKVMPDYALPESEWPEIWKGETLFTRWDEIPLSLEMRVDGNYPHNYGYCNNMREVSGTLSLRDIDRIQKAT